MTLEPHHWGYPYYPIWVSSYRYTVLRLMSDGKYHQIETDNIHWQESYYIYSVDIPLNANFTIYYVHPLSGEVISLDLEITSPNSINEQALNENFNPWGSTLYYYLYPERKDDKKIGFSAIKAVWDFYNGVTYEEFFLPVRDTPIEIRDFRRCVWGHIENIIQTGQGTNYIIFDEARTHTPFGVQVNGIFEENYWANHFIQWSTVYQKENSVVMYAECHEKITAIDDNFLIFVRLDLHPENFDFQQELERSNQT